MKVTFRQRAIADMQEMIRYGAETYGEAAATDYFRRLQRRISQLRDNPKLGRPFSEIRSEGFRVLTFERHVILYRLAGAEIDVFRIVDGRRNWQAFLAR